MATKRKTKKKAGKSTPPRASKSKSKARKPAARKAATRKATTRKATPRKAAPSKSAPATDDKRLVIAERMRDEARSIVDGQSKTLIELMHETEHLTRKAGGTEAGIANERQVHFRIQNEIG